MYILPSIRVSKNTYLAIYNTHSFVLLFKCMDFITRSVPRPKQADKTGGCVKKKFYGSTYVLAKKNMSVVLVLTFAYAS